MQMMAGETTLHAGFFGSRNVVVFLNKVDDLYFLSLDRDEA